jgi:hypothetical protein
MTRRTTTWLSLLAPALGGVAVLAFSILAVRQYGLGAFAGTPFCVGMAASWIQARLGQRSFAAAFLTALGAVGLMGLGVLLVALDGAICILMAMPLAVGLGTVGALAGFGLARMGSRQSGARANLAIVAFLPALVAAEGRLRNAAPERAVTTSVEIAADAATVWDNVVEFAPIEAPPSGLFRLGIACPIGARIEGRGVGAIRYCEFSTGAFVEPIRVWEEPRRLAFDVVENPPPMREWSPYGDVMAPHLAGTFVSHRGQFLLAQRGDATVLEGTTWYTQNMWPQWYWGGIADGVIHRIHLRVLEHIKAAAERRQGQGPS